MPKYRASRKAVSAVMPRFSKTIPGCPLTFQLAEALRPLSLPLERFVLPEAAPQRPPDLAVAEKLWRTQFPDTRRWELADGHQAFKPDFHFSLLALARCEVQAIDQHWSLHRLALSLPDGELDDSLAREMGFQHTGGQAGVKIVSPSPDPAAWGGLLQRALERELAEGLVRIRARQDQSLHREWERIDDYFEHYERELNARAKRSANEKARMKTADRLAAAKAEHARRRADQVARHEIRVHPHLEALLLVAETACHAQVEMESTRGTQGVEARFVPRSRRWVLGDR